MKKEALQEQVYRKIKDRIVSCEMLPGSVVSEDTLASEFGTSRTPIREALLRLQREHLIDIYPRQGTFVSPISLQDIYEIYQIRLLMEPKIARIASRRLERAQLERYQTLVASGALQSCSFKEWFQYDRELHDYIVRCTQNRHLIQMYEVVMDQNQRMRILAGRIPKRMEATNEEHIAIIQALISQDEDLIEKVMTEHIIASRDAVLKLEGYINE
ncbi:MAG TPA: GntR family transcriptional regulator [Spirochaetales bacterium]|nr:GntR family transcriptional regulator [Spirochaetales bacterium]